MLKAFGIGLAWLTATAPFVGVVPSCVSLFVILMALEWRRICRKYPLDHLPRD
jgi:hypothetical protein